jgi:hypothetical protein
MNRRAFLGVIAATPSTLAAFELGGREAFAKIERRREVYPLVGPYLYSLRANYPTVYRYLNAVDIGHAQLAEVLVTNPANEERTIYLLEHVQWNNVRQMFLDPPKAPRLAPAEETVAPESSKTAWRLSQAFDWTHVLHRQIYDILASAFPPARKARYIGEAYRWYRSEPLRAFPGKLKTHDLMEHQPFSQYWREKYPRFNAAIWAYHWYQLRLNEVMLESQKDAQKAGVVDATAEFRAMFENPALLPHHMPMAHEIAPRFLAEFPEIAQCFDNLHSFHDIYNDILAHPQITNKQTEVYRQLDVFLDPTKALESAPMHPLPGSLSAADLRRLNQLSHIEHMAMMVMSSSDEELDFLRHADEERLASLEALRPVMAQTWPNFERKHAGMVHAKHRRQDHQN